MSDYEIRPDQSALLLKELHILTADGKMNQDSRRKLKQVYHLYQFIEKLLQKMTNQDPVIVDHGAGKSYLGFILYDLYFKKQNSGTVIGVETRQDLVEKSQKLAESLQFIRMQFFKLAVQEAMESDKLPKKVDMVTALHACDTATDDAILFGLKKEASFMVLVPCCQAELARLLKENKKEQNKNALSEIWRHSLHTREFGSHLTNVLRCLWLEAHGYQVTVTELVGWEHSMKNELIIAEKKQSKNSLAEKKLQELLHELNLDFLYQRYHLMR